MTAASRSVDAGERASEATRWGQLIFGIICMVMIANLQYGWTLFVNPIDQKYHWGRAAIQVAFTIFVLTETWLVPLEGYLIDKFGPRLMVSGSGFLVAVAWVMNAFADSLLALYVAAAIGGIGAGVVYGACVGNALKWFPDHRGLAAGLTAAGFGAGSALTVIPIANMIQTSGYEAAFLWFGLAQGIVVMLFALFLRAPQASELPAAAAAVQQSRRDYEPAEVLNTPVFWVMYLMFVMVGAGGLMATAQLAPIANDFKIANVPVSILGLTLPALSFALSIDRVLNGFCRPFFGWVSDNIGRENTMFIAFLFEGIGIYALLLFADNPLMFVLLSGVVFFAWGEIYSLFPATCTDIYGKKFATTNYGMLYTAKGTAALLVPLGNVLYDATGKSWTAVFIVAAILNLVAAVMALTLLKPMRARTISGLSPLPDGMVKPLGNPISFVLLYLVFMAPLYLPQWLGMDWVAQNTSGMAATTLEMLAAVGSSQTFWIHLVCWTGLIILAFVRGVAIEHGWLVALAIVGAFFDLVPGVSSLLGALLDRVPGMSSSWAAGIPMAVNLLVLVCGAALRPEVAPSSASASASA
jgi:MFS transporter, OFA family, oxalate/formate antiporter